VATGQAQTVVLAVQQAQTVTQVQALVIQVVAVVALELAVQRVAQVAQTQVAVRHQVLVETQRLIVAVAVAVAATQVMVVTVGRVKLLSDI